MTTLDRGSSDTLAKGVSPSLAGPSQPVAYKEVPYSPCLVPSTRRFVGANAAATTIPLDFRQEVTRALGLTEGCPLPGHTGHEATLVTRNDQLVLECPRDKDWWSLGHVRAARAYGTCDKRWDRSRLEVLIWHRELAFEVGSYVPALPAVKELPDGTLSSVRAVWEWFIRVAAYRWHEPDLSGLPILFSRRFAAMGAGVSSTTADRAIHRLLAADHMSFVGKMGSGNPDYKDAHLYLPVEPGPSCG